MRREQARREVDSSNPNKWISVETALPEINKNVLAYNGSDIYVASRYIHGEWLSWNINHSVHTPIIFWMPLPEPPVVN